MDRAFTSYCDNMHQQETVYCQSTLNRYQLQKVWNQVYNIESNKEEVGLNRN